jgi:chromate transporter
MRDNLPLALLVVFVPFSLVSIGGGTSILAGIQHEAVDVHHWISTREFVELFAISRVAPGPGSRLATLIGWHVFGWTGALIATLALFVPSSLLCYGVVLAWNRHRGKSWHTALEKGLAPVGVGLVMAGVLTVLRVSGGGLLSWIVAFGSAGLMSWRPKIHPLLVFLVGGAIFVVARALSGVHTVS